MATKSTLFEDLEQQLEAEGDTFIVTREWLNTVRHQLSFRRTAVAPIMLPAFIDDDALDEFDSFMADELVGNTHDTARQLVDWYDAGKMLGEPVAITTESFMLDGAADYSYHVLLNGWRAPFTIHRRGRHWGLFRAGKEKPMLVQAHSIQDLAAKLSLLWNSKID